MKTFVLDTSVLLYDPTCIRSFKNSEVVLPLIVLDELDTAKLRPDMVGRNARVITKQLDQMRSLGFLSQGVEIDGNIKVKVELNHIDNIPSGLLFEKNDNRIIGVALGLQKEGKDVCVITKDINLRVKCDALQLKAEDYNNEKMAEDPEEIYSGFKNIEVSSKLIDDLYAKGEIRLEECFLYPNQFVILKSSSEKSHAGIGRFVDGKIKVVKPVREVSDIYPRNLEQKLAFDLLLDPNIKLVTLVGIAGGGKSLISSAGALYHLQKIHSVNKILITRPTVPMGRDIGFLPGDANEKLAPWMRPIEDSLEFILGGDKMMISMMKERGQIQIEPLTYIRGRSIPKAFIILDEAQNLSPQEIKTIITRVGENTKIVITGDITQIDSPYLDFADNGLTYVVERFKEYGIAGHITLQKCERSELAELATKIL